MKVVGRIVMGGTRERNLVRCSACGRLGHLAANCFITKPCLKCGRYGHTLAN